MVFDSTLDCPFYKEPCHKHQCAFYIALRGTDPQTGHDIDEWGCAIVWNVVAALEGNKEVRQGAAAVESLRNEMVRIGELARLERGCGPLRLTDITSRDEDDAS